MESRSFDAKRIAIFGHYGNKNLGDESIIETMLVQMRKCIEAGEFVCMSIDPVDSANRYQVESFPIRHKIDRETRAITPKDAAVIISKLEDRIPIQEIPQDHPKSSFKKRLKDIPLLGSILKQMVTLKDRMVLICHEIRFLIIARRYVKTLDLIIVSGSNQFLDNFGGAWGFPYTLFKWTLLAKMSGVKVAFASVGAGPLTGSLSFRMLSYTLKASDYLSYRDEGSKALIESRIEVDGGVYPDIAHALDYQQISNANITETLSIAVNPMPVYDGRYWPVDNPEKYEAYIKNIEILCIEILRQGHSINMFGTQIRDADTITDIITKLRMHPQYPEWESKLSVATSDTVNQLMEIINSADIIVATRFHATVLPLQMGKPVLGICYYRKAAELLDEVGLSEYHVDIDDFEAKDLVHKFNALQANYVKVSERIRKSHATYTEALTNQFTVIASLVN